MKEKFLQSFFNITEKFSGKQIPNPKWLLDRIYYFKDRKILRLKLSQRSSGIGFRGLSILTFHIHLMLHISCSLDAEELLANQTETKKYAE